jgi:hypothetical protein
MKKLAKFWDYFLLGGPSPALLGAFTLGLLVVGVLGNFTYDLLTGQLPTGLGNWLPLAGALALTGVAYLLYRWDQQHVIGIGASVDERRLAPPHAGLIWMFGPGNFGHLFSALKHHHTSDKTTHCWLVMQNTAPVQKAYNQLSETLIEAQLNVQIHPAYIEALTMQAAYEATRGIFERECFEVDLHPEDVIADITGGRMPLTAGMVLAALTCDGALEYVETDRDDEGKPVPGTEHVVLADMDFYITRGPGASETPASQ